MKATTLLITAAALVAVSGCAKQEPAGAHPSASTPPPSAPSSAAPARTAAGLTRVTDASYTCMVNNMFMGKPQIPVQVEGKTYYGCCEMCKDRLANNPAARTAVDPVSKRPVDKSLAVIARADSGELVYFENEANLTAYRP
jgi:YHS domain-containing protein